MSDSNGGRDSFDPFSVVSLCGPDAKRWMEEYRQEPIYTPVRWSEAAVSALRSRRLEAGEELLDRVKNRLQSLEGKIRPSLFHVLDRWYTSALAYLHYCRDEMEQAHASLFQAHDAVRAAIERRPFLMILATHCYDFRLQHARIARNCRRWTEMRRHIATGREMLDNRQPLCRLDNGEDVFLREVDALGSTILESLEGPPEELRRFFDAGARRTTFESFVREIHALPGFVILP
jgi:hypothetical protein